MAGDIGKRALRANRAERRMIPRRAWSWYAFAAAVLAADQASKRVALDNLVFGVSVDVLPFLSWTLTCNTGAAFSMLQGYGWLFAGVAALVSLYLAFEIRRLARAARSFRLEGTACSLIMAGALGNLVDRLTRACVVDFVHVHYGWFNYPVFNVADSAITVGAAVWIWLLLFRDKRTRRDDS